MGKAKITIISIISKDIVGRRTGIYTDFLVKMTVITLLPAIQLGSDS